MVLSWFVKKSLFHMLCFSIYVYLSFDPRGALFRENLGRNLVRNLKPGREKNLVRSIVREKPCEMITYI